MGIFDELLKYQDYSVGVSVYGELIVLTAVFPSNWEIKGDKEGKIIFKEDAKESGKYHFIVSSKEKANQKLLLDNFKRIVEDNTEQEEKEELLETYIERLEDLFKTKKLSELKKLVFTFKGKKTEKEEIKPSDDVND